MFEKKNQSIWLKTNLEFDSNCVNKGGSRKDTVTHQQFVISCVSFRIVLCISKVEQPILHIWLGVIHKLRLQIFGLLWPPFLLNYTLS